MPCKAFLWKMQEKRLNPSLKHAKKKKKNTPIKSFKNIMSKLQNQCRFRAYYGKLRQIRKMMDGKKVGDKD